MSHCRAWYIAEDSRRVPNSNSSGRSAACAIPQLGSALVIIMFICFTLENGKRVSLSLKPNAPIRNWVPGQAIKYYEAQISGMKIQCWVWNEATRAAATVGGLVPDGAGASDSATPDATPDGGLVPDGAGGLVPDGAGAGGELLPPIADGFGFDALPASAHRRPGVMKVMKSMKAMKKAKGKIPMKAAMKATKKAAMKSNSKSSKTRTAMKATKKGTKNPSKTSKMVAMKK
jgi:hypothetical protein